MRAQLLEIMTQQKIHINSCGNDWDVARKAVCSAYFHNAAKIKVRVRMAPRPLATCGAQIIVLYPCSKVVIR